jgi:hypothetical protein
VSTAAKRLSNRRYLSSPKGKAASLRAHQRYHSKPKGAAVLKRATAKFRSKRYAMINALKTYPACCFVCGISGLPEMLEFHHRLGTVKLFGIAQGYCRYTWEKVLAEIAKCDLVCSNHHASITAGRSIEEIVAHNDAFIHTRLASPLL